MSLGVAVSAKPAAEPAATFIALAQRELLDVVPDANRAAWLASTHATPDTERLNARLSTEAGLVALRLARQADAYRGQGLAPDQAQSLLLLRTRIENPVPEDPAAAADTATLRARLMAANAVRSVRVNDTTFRSYGALRDAMERSDDPARLVALWSTWAGTGGVMKADYAAFVARTNEGARALGFADTGALWRAANDTPGLETQAETARVWAQIAPFYRLVHCYVRKRLNATYGDRVQPRTGPIRIDLTRNPVGMFWRGLTAMTSPWPDGSQAVDAAVDARLRQQSLSGVQMASLAEDFYVSLGYPKLPESFWQRSMLEKPADRVVDCSGSATHIEGRDVRLKFCATSDLTALRTMVHEVGHVYYALSYADQPLLFQNGANDAFHEALADFPVMSMTPAYFQRVGLLDPGIGNSANVELRQLWERTLERLPLLAYAVAFEQWRWDVFAGRTQPADYNRQWWRLVADVQGLAPPTPRPDDGFDAAAVPHLANNMPYNRYFFANVLQHQFLARACTTMGWQGPLHRCSIYGKTQIGARMRAVAALGASVPWPQALDTFGIEGRYDAAPLLAYYQPLVPWLKAQTKGEQCGW
ncbi:M2 family metallopeptidase [Sandaracinobacteroides saxicola]|uniref:M2 family metallopeptidase n=1 Tax=Sandaracinobacteroides saxicola TaxID=2759707 RepID=A0A7G5IDW7_9SPHN|nr:M2 family metallopeptidase [Sandaracinobacteroides saxicola]QMW21559.1 M2 family metallopeptidase [Sandaracinobacteroides saxicola]